MAIVKSANYTTPKTILIAPEVAVAFPVIVSNAGVSADENGRKIIKAGSAIGGSTNVLMNRQTALAKVADATAQGLLLHDVDVTDGNGNGTILIAGYVDVNKIAKDTIPAEEVQTALSRIVFMKGE